MPPNTVAKDISWALPEPRQIFTQEYFTNPVFQTKAIKNVAVLYYSLSTSVELFSSLHAPTQVYQSLLHTFPGVRLSP